MHLLAFEHLQTSDLQSPLRLTWRERHCLEAEPARKNIQVSWQCSNLEVQHGFKQQSLFTDFQFKLPHIVIYVFLLALVDVQNKKKYEVKRSLTK